MQTQQEQVRCEEHQRALLTTTEAAKHLNVTPRFLEVRRIRGGGPAFIRFSTRAVRYRVQDLDAWIAQKLNQ